MSPLSFVLELHSFVRWLVVIVAVVAAIRFVFVLAGQTANERLDRVSMAAWSGLIDLQILLGLIYLLGSAAEGAGLPRYRLEHAVILFVAAILAHLAIRWRNAEPKIRARNNLLLIVGVLALVFVGVARLPQGWLG